MLRPNWGRVGPWPVPSGRCRGVDARTPRPLEPAAGARHVSGWAGAGPRIADGGANGASHWQVGSVLHPAGVVVFATLGVDRFAGQQAVHQVAELSHPAPATGRPCRRARPAGYFDWLLGR